MAITWIEGFDLEPSGGIIGSRYPNSAGGLAYAAGRFGVGQALGLDNALGWWTIPLPATTDTITLGLAIRFTSGNFNNAGTASRFIEFLDATDAIQMQIGINSLHAILAGRTNLTNQRIGSSAINAAEHNVWHYLEIEITRHASAGSVNAYLNGANILSVSGANTGSAAFQAIKFWGQGGGRVDWDDLYVTNTAARLGELRVDTIRPNADTATKGFTPNSGTTNYTQVDETTYDGDTSYVAAAAPLTVDMYGVADLPGLPTSVKALKTIMVARKDDAATREVRSKLKSGGTTADGPPAAMTTTFTYRSTIYENDPDISGPWTAAAVNAIELGVEVVT